MRTIFKPVLITLALLVAVIACYAGDVGPFYEPSGAQNYKVSVSQSAATVVMRKQLRPWQWCEVYIDFPASVAFQTATGPTNSATFPAGHVFKFQATDQFVGPIVMQASTTNPTTASVVGIRQ